MAKLALQFETVGGEKQVVRVQDVKWAYQSGSDYFIEWLDPRINQWRQAEITSGSYAAIDQLQTVSAQNFGDTPVVGSIKVNPHAITLANNVGGLDVQILSAGQLAFTGGGGANWTIANNADAGTWATSGGVMTITGDSAPVAAENATITSAVAVVNGQKYTFGVRVNAAAVGSRVIGTDFDLSILVGATTYDLVAADLVAGNTILVEHTATATGNINVVLRYTAVEENDQTAVVVGFTEPSFRRQTGSNQLVGILDGTLVRYEVGNTPMSLLLTTGVSALVSGSNTALVSYVPTTVNETAWTGGDLAASAFMKFNVVSEVESGVSVISLDAQQSSLRIGTTTAIGSLDS
jgi:hypothetical protein